MMTSTRRGIESRLPQLSNESPSEARSATSMATRLFVQIVMSISSVKKGR